jgi:hypothetical protein
MDVAINLPFRHLDLGSFEMIFRENWWAILITKHAEIDFKETKEW